MQKVKLNMISLGAFEWHVMYKIRGSAGVGIFSWVINN